MKNISKEPETKQEDEEQKESDDEGPIVADYINIESKFITFDLK